MNGISTVQAAIAGGKRFTAHDRHPDDPTPEEIEQETAAIRSQWTDAETERRWQGPRRQAADTQVCRLHRRVRR